MSKFERLSEGPKTYSIQVQNAFIRPSPNLRFFSEQEVELFDSLSAHELSKVLYESKTRVMIDNLTFLTTFLDSEENLQFLSESPIF